MSVVHFPHRLRLVDWRTLVPERIAPLYAAEVERWQRVLDWDTAARWQEIELKRREGTAAGLAVVDEAGQVRGWCRYSVRDRVLRIETFDAGLEQIAEMMLERLVSAPVLAYIERVEAFLFSDVSGLPQALRARGLTVDRYWYFGRELDPAVPPAPPGFRPWRPEDAPATAVLLAASYDPKVESRPFAPSGTPEQWTAYMNDILRGAHGAVLREASLCVPAGPDRLAAVLLMTRIGEHTGHVVQLAVDPSLRRRRIGQQLLEMAGASAARAGYRRATVIAGGTNRAARGFLDALRYRSMGSFLAAGTFHPQRSTGTVFNTVGHRNR